MATPRTHCHFTMHARSLRVPDSCDDSLHQFQACSSSPSFSSPVQKSASTCESHGALQALCPASMLHTVPSVHRFRRAPLALSQVPLCQPRSLRPPCNSLLSNSLSAASPWVFLRRPRYLSPHHFWMPQRRLFHTSLSLETLLRNSRSKSSWLHLLRTMFSAPRVLEQSPRYFLMPCRRLCTAPQLMMPPLNYRSRFFSGCIFF